jgi:hypothetical protein
MVMHMPICRVRRGIDKDREDDRDSSVDKPAPPISAPSASTVRKNPSRVVPDQIGECALLCSALLCSALLAGLSIMRAFEALDVALFFS